MARPDSPARLSTAASPDAKDVDPLATVETLESKPTSDSQTTDNCTEVWDTGVDAWLTLAGGFVYADLTCRCPSY